MRKPIQISIVVPVYNEEESLPVLYDEICEALAATDWSVDDGSAGASAARRIWAALAIVSSGVRPGEVSIWTLPATA